MTITISTRGGQPAAREPFAALCLASSGSYAHIDMYVPFTCLLHLKSVRYFRVRRRYGDDIHGFYEFDVALCDITIGNVALSLSLVGHPSTRPIL